MRIPGAAALRLFACAGLAGFLHAAEPAGRDESLDTVPASASGLPGFEGTGTFRRERADPFAGISPLEPEDLDFLESLKFRPAPDILMRPTGVPWFLPGELGLNRNGDRPGPGIGFDLRWSPSRRWRVGADLIVRADRLDANNQMHDWTTYLAPGIEYFPYPNAERPFSVGLVAPIALRSETERWSGLFVVVRWEEVLSKVAHRRR